MGVFLRFKGNHNFTDIRRYQQSVQFIEGPQVFFFIVQQIRIPDKSLDMEAQFRLFLNILFILLRQLPGSDHNHMLQIKAFAPESPEHQPHKRVFADQENKRGQIKDQQDATGEINQTENEQQGGGKQRGNRDCRQDGPNLPDQPAGPRCIVKTQNGKQEGKNQRISDRQQQGFPADCSHVPLGSVQKIQTQPGCQHISQDHQQNIRENIHSVQESLILPDHAPYPLFPHVMTKNCSAGI